MLVLSYVECILYLDLAFINNFYVKIISSQETNKLFVIRKKTISKTSRITSFLLFTKLDNTKQRNVKR